MRVIFGTCLCALLALHIGAALSFADTFNYTAQTRTVVAVVGATGAGSSGQTFSAPGFGDFNQTASGTMSPGGPSGYVSQHQHSTLLPEIITISGDFSGLFPSYAGTGYSQGHSTTDVTFTVAQQTGAYIAINAQQTGNGDYDARLRPNVRISTPGSEFPYFYHWESSPSGNQLSNYSAIQDLLLPPGTYTLHTYFDSYLAFLGAYSTPSFSVVLAVPEPSSFLLAAPALLLPRRRAKNYSKSFQFSQH